MSATETPSGTCPVCEQPINNGKHWYCGTEAQYGEEQAALKRRVRA